MTSKFSDDRKGSGFADSKNISVRLREAIDQMECWQNEFNPDKYNVVDYGKSIRGGYLQ